MSIPMCWKCHEAKMVLRDANPIPNYALVGCKANKKITDWDSATALCPLRELKTNNK